MHLKQEELLLVGPDFFVDLGVEVVVPTLSTLFSSTIELLVPFLEMVGHRGPVIEADLPYNLSKDSIFLDKAVLTLLVQFFLMREI